MKTKFVLFVIFILGCLSSKANIIRIDSDWKRNETFKFYAMDEWSLENGEILPCHSGVIAMTYTVKDKSCAITISFIDENKETKKEYTNTLKNVYVEYNEDNGGWFVYDCETEENVLSYITNEDPNNNILLLSPKIRIN